MGAATATGGVVTGNTNCHGTASGAKLGCAGSDDTPNSKCFLGVFQWNGDEDGTSAASDTTIIQILGSDQMTLEATHQGNYIDDGATCSDQVDGVISQNVEVSGDVVNLSKVGTYTITYNCKDSANNEAP